MEYKFERIPVPPLKSFIDGIEWKKGKGREKVRSYIDRDYLDRWSTYCKFKGWQMVDNAHLARVYGMTPGGEFIDEKHWICTPTGLDPYLITEAEKDRKERGW